MLVDVSEEGRCSSHSSMEDVSQSPPPKEDEFEKFKKGRGQKIHEAFLGNKGSTPLSDIIGWIHNNVTSSNNGPADFVLSLHSSAPMNLRNLECIIL